MPKVSPIYTSFNGGEFSPLLYGRTDFQKYGTGGKTVLNFISTIQGPLERRPGTMFVAEVKDSSKKTRLLEFEFSTTQAYIIEAGENYFRFYKDQAQITESGLTITNITQANPAVVTITGHPYANGDHVYIDSVVGMTEINIPTRYTVANVTANTFELSGIDSTAFTAYSSGGLAYRIYEVTSTFLEAELFDIKFTQSADVMYLTHPLHAPQTLSRSGHTSWTLADFAFSAGPFETTNSTATTLAASAATGSVTLTASAVTGINDDTGFQSTDIGRFVRIKNTNWAWGEITAYTSTTVVTVLVKDGSFPTVATGFWRLGVFSDTTGYPSCVTFFEDRLCFAGSTNNPQRVDGSQNGDYPNFAPTETDGTVLASNAIAFVLNSNAVNVVRWLQDDERGLFIGTVGGEWILKGTGGAALAANAAPQAVRSTNYGSANIQPERVGKATLFVQKSKRKVRELKYIFQDDGFSAPDTTELSEHVTVGGIDDTTFQQEPYSVVWAVRGDGELLGLTYEKEQNVVAWHRHELGGTSVITETVASIPATDGSRDETWVIVKRTINGGTKRYIEYITPIFDSSTVQADAIFVDSALQYSGAAVSSLSGLDHLEGESVSVLLDGAAHPDVTVTNGAITLQESGEKISVGLGYVSDFETLRIEAGAADGTAQGKTKRIHRVIFRLNRSLGMKVGPNSSELETQSFREGSDLMDTAVPLFTGDFEVDWDGDYETEGHIFVRQDQPLPLTIVAIMPHLVTQDR